MPNTRPAELPPITAAAGAPQAPVAPPVVGNLFTERPSTQEVPELRITNDTGRWGALVVWEGTYRGEWNLGSLLQVPIHSGKYNYALYGPFYQRSGRPDMTGRLRCRRYHLYEVTLVLGYGNETTYDDLGDSD